MKFSIRFADKIVGTLVLLALAILVFVIFMLGKSQRWFARDYQYTTYFSTASGLSPNMAVQYKGFTIGHVKNVMLTDDNRVEVIFNIFEEHNHRVRRGTIVELQASPIGLGNSFLFYQGKGEQLPEGAEIPELTSDKAKEIIEKNMVDRPETDDSIGNIVNQVNALLESLNKSIGPAEEGGDPPIQIILADLEKTIEDISLQVGPLLNGVDLILADLKIVTEQLSEPSGTVMSFLDSNGPIYTDLVGLLDSVNGILKSLDDTVEYFPTQVPSLLSDLNAALRSAQDVLVSLTNNPLLRGGVPERKETGPSGANSRNLEF
jgi:phospholipid/cholesterol/gamma-HCH transport system substrate-binding protein